MNYSVEFNGLEAVIVRESDDKVVCRSIFTTEMNGDALSVWVLSSLKDKRFDKAKDQIILRHCKDYKHIKMAFNPKDHPDEK